MANVYGSRNKNQFKLPSVESKETYYTLVNTETGEITLKRITPLVLDSPIGGFAESLDATVGTIAATGSDKGKFIPAAGITPTEKLAFSQQPQAVKTVKDQAAKTSNNAQKDLGVDQTTRESRTNEILDTGQASTPTTGAETGEGTEASEENVNKGAANLSNLAGSIKSSETTRLISNYPEDRLLRYPLDMSGKQDCITFTMLEYAAKKFSSSSSDFAKGEAQSKREGSEKRRGKTVTLPIQPSVSDSNVVKWGAEDMNAFQAIAAAAALSTITDGVGGGIAALEGSAKLIANQKESLGAVTATYFAGEAAGVKGLLTRATGGIINPNTELLFQGPDLRSFNFTFSLSAREPDEAKRIRNIIRFFKQGMSVKRADTALFLKSPHTFEIKYLFGGKPDHPWINKIKECALTSCNVNYTPAGNYATYEDGSMTQYDISLSFSELEPIYDDDYGNGGGTGNETEIGY
jgi:hypothetical protein